jgi:hypothetical protein
MSCEREARLEFMVWPDAPAITPHTCWEDIRHQHKRLILDIRRCLHSRRVRKWHSHKLGLRAIKRPTAKQQTLRASRRKPVLAVEAITTGHSKGRDHVISHFKVLHGRPDLVDVSGEFVAHDEVGAGGLVAAVDVEFTGRRLVIRRMLALAWWWLCVPSA